MPHFPHPRMSHTALSAPRMSRAAVPPFPHPPMSRAALSEPTALEDMNARIVVDSGFSVIVLRNVMRWEEVSDGPVSSP